MPSWLRPRADHHRLDKGQVTLPKSIRERRHWAAGTRLLVENTAEGVLLKVAPIFAPTRPEDVFGSLPHSGPPKSLAEIDAGGQAANRLGTVKVRAP
ncbi:MAG TPA: AbrB/MazE/SpoVT family DNA-binding domain-containing protein [Stellaceae bacterium]|nr:AbrB/MazE/SpoVT family DNA-binding domain-containing protein [Stellaceae bacterium]